MSAVDSRPTSLAPVRIRSALGEWSRWARSFVLVVTDLAAHAASVGVAYLAWARPVRGQPPEVYLPLLPLLLLFVLANANAGLYPGFGLGAVETIRRLSVATGSVFLSLAAISFVLKAPQVYSRMTFALAWVGSLALVPLFRFLVLSVARAWRWWGEPCVVVGSGELARRTVSALQRARSLGYRPCAVVSDEPHERSEVAGVPVVGDLSALAALAARGVRVALVAEGPGEATSMADELRYQFRHVLWIRDHRDLPVEGLQVRNLGGVLGVEFVNQLLRRRNRALKRATDLVLATLALVVTAPILLVAALLLRLRSTGPVLYRQAREGSNGRTFDVLKLRTMHVDAEDRLERHLAASPEARREWEARVKLADDPRVIPGIGGWIRRFSVDELPQLVNVLRGDMSLVGPRPFPEYHLERFSDAFRELRRRVRPGLTGLWQVMVRSEGGVAEQEAYDTYYIRNWSLWMDFYVLAKTVAAVLRGRGAY